MLSLIIWRHAYPGSKEGRARLHEINETDFILGDGRGRLFEEGGGSVISVIRSAYDYNEF